MKRQEQEARAERAAIAAETKMDAYQYGTVDLPPDPEAPERIWALTTANTGRWASGPWDWPDPRGEGAVEYVRADTIADLRAKLAATEAERDRAMQACEQIGARAEAAAP